MREMAGILDMAALGASEAPADLAFSLKGALRPAVRDDDVEYEGMCRCLVEMLLNKEGMFCCPGRSSARCTRSATRWLRHTRIP